jgi:hypothetical protein
LPPTTTGTGTCQAVDQAGERSGADAAKFQNFSAPKIVSDFGFKSWEGQQSHQSKWKKSVFEFIRCFWCRPDWTPILKEECDKVGIDYFSSPYDFEATNMLGCFRTGLQDRLGRESTGLKPGKKWLQRQSGTVGYGRLPSGKCRKQCTLSRRSRAVSTDAVLNTNYTADRITSTTFT